MEDKKEQIEADADETVQHLSLAGGGYRQSEVTQKKMVESSKGTIETRI